MVNRGVIQDDGLNGRIERGNFYSQDELDTGLCNGKEYYDSHFKMKVTKVISKCEELL